MERFSSIIDLCLDIFPSKLMIFKKKVRKKNSNKDNKFFR